MFLNRNELYAKHSKNVNESKVDTAVLTNCIGTSYLSTILTDVS